MRGVLNISACPSGLRIGIMKIFGVFCRDFFVPWREIRVERRDGFFGQTAELKFGDALGKLSISGHVADRLARSASGRWPEAGPFPEETKSQAFAAVAKQWAVLTCFAAFFFILAPRALSPGGAFPPISIAILFPAVMFGIVGVFEYFSRIKR